MDFITVVSRYILPVITVMLLSKCIMALLLGHPKEKIYGFIIDMKTGEKYALNMWETSIGRSSTNDIVLTYNTVSRSHAVISRRIDGWYVYDLDSKSGIKVNGVACEQKATIKDMDIVSLSGIPFRFEVADDPVQRVGKKNKAHSNNGNAGRDSEFVEPSQAGYQPQPQSEDALSYGDTPVYTFGEQDFYDESNKPDLGFSEKTDEQYYGAACDDIYSQTGSYTVETPDGPVKGQTFFRPRLINKDTGEIFILCGNEVIIGSGMKCDIRLRSHEVAKMHAVLILYEDGWAIRSASRTPTYLNGQSISSVQLLFDGDVIAMGDERLYYKTNR